MEFQDINPEVAMGGTRLMASGWRWDREGAAVGRNAQGFSARGINSSGSLAEGNSASHPFAHRFPSNSSFQKKLTAAEKNELHCIARESDPEVFSDALLRFGQRLEETGKADLAAQVYETLLSPSFVRRGQGEVETPQVSEHSHLYPSLTLQPYPPEADPSFGGQRGGDTVLQHAQQRLDALSGRGTIGRRVEILLKNFTESATDHRMILPMIAASALYPIGKTASFIGLVRNTPAAWWSRGVGAQLLSSAIGFGLEGSTFYLAQRGLSQLSSETQLRASFADSILTLGAFKLFSWGGRQLSRGKGWGESASSFAGLLAVQRLENLDSPSPNGLLASLPETFSNFVALMAGAHLGRRLVGRNFLHLQKELELRATDAGSSAPLTWLPHAAPILAGSPVSFRPRTAVLPSNGISLMAPMNPDSPGGPGPKLKVFPKTPPPELAEHLKATFLPRFAGATLPANVEKIISTALKTEANQARFHERLLSAYATAPNRGSLDQVYTALAIMDLFTCDSISSPTGSFDGVLLQTLIRRALAEEAGGRRNAVMQEIFAAMERKPSRTDFVGIMEQAGFARELDVSLTPRYSQEFWERHGEEARKALRNYFPPHAVPLLNEVYRWASHDPALANKLLVLLERTRTKSPYGPGLIDGVIDYAIRRPLGTLALRRMFQVFLVQDIPAKLREILDESPRSDTPDFIFGLKQSGLDEETIAQRINASHHTAFLDDMRLARKVVSVMLETKPYLVPGHPERNLAFQNLNRGIETLINSGGSLGIPEFFSLLGVKYHGKYDFSLKPHPQAQRLAELMAAHALEVSILLEADFKAELARRPHLDPGLRMFFSQAKSPGENHRILIRDLIPANPDSPSERDQLRGGILYRTSGLLHEGTHYLQVSGKDEAIEGHRDVKAFDLRGISREDRLASEIMAYLEEDRWYSLNYDIEWWLCASRLGVNLPLYFRNTSDEHYFAAGNEKLLASSQERPEDPPSPKTKPLAPPSFGPPRLFKIASKSFPPYPSPPEAKKLQDRFRYGSNFPPGEISDKIIEGALTTRGGQPHFHQSLLEAYQRQADAGSIGQFYNALAIKSAFLTDALQTSTGSYDNALLQGLIRLAVADENEYQRRRAMDLVFESMPAGINRRDLTGMMEALGYAQGLEVDSRPAYPKEFGISLKEEVQRHWEGFRREDIVPLLNLVHHWNPRDREKATRLIRRLGSARQSGKYQEKDLNGVLDHAKSHSLGYLALNRFVQVLAAQDSPAKLIEMLDDRPKNDSIPTILGLAREGMEPEAIAQRINGTHHTAYLQDMRLARKIVSVTLDAGPFLSEDHPQRAFARQQIQAEFFRLTKLGKTLSPEDYLNLLELTPNPIARALRFLIQTQQLEIVILSDAAFEAEILKRPLLKGCHLCFFSQATPQTNKHRITLRDLPEPSAIPERILLGEGINRMAGLLHEGHHLLQVLGWDESIYGWNDVRSFDLSQMSREEGLVSELMALLEEERWFAKNDNLDFWSAAHRLGENLPLFLRNSQDHFLFGSANDKRMEEVREEITQ